MLDKFLFEMNKQSVEIFHSVENENGVEVGEIEGIIHYKFNRLENWLDTIKASKETVDYFNKMKEEIVPVAIIKDMHVDEDEREKGYGNILMNKFLDDLYGVNYIVLEADAGMKQKRGFRLIDFYRGYGFEKVGQAGYNPVMMMEFM